MDEAGRTRTARAYHHRFLARLQGNGGHAVDTPCFVDQHADFRTTLPVDVVAELQPGGEALWDLRPSAYGGPEIRLAMLAGDVVAPPGTSACFRPSGARAPAKGCRCGPS
ncbi:hypothetical protein ACFC8N_24370 [Streptomyces sp. NPDC055966]|uniref:hypothetical protein n=1 Tax=unclassified Streptomyces TaxID=2593676 RepID=UPI0035E1AB4A